MSDLKDMFLFERADTCAVCGAPRSIELYNIFDSPLHFTYALDSDKTKDLSKYNARYFMCKECKEQFPIHWLDGRPIPLTLENYQMFMSTYKILSKK